MAKYPRIQSSFNFDVTILGSTKPVIADQSYIISSGAANITFDAFRVKPESFNDGITV
jgi:hypothetical protein